MSHRKPLRALLLGSGVAALVWVTAIDAQQTAHSAKPCRTDVTALRNAGRATDAFAGSWLSYGLTQGETRFSPLHQINAQNVTRLGLSWTHALGAGGGNQDATPLVGTVRFTASRTGASFLPSMRARLKNAGVGIRR